MGRVVLLFVLLVAPGVGAAEGKGGKLTGTISVVASIPPLASLAKSIGQDLVDARALITRAVDPHDFELKVSDLSLITDSELVIFVGGGFEFWSKGLSDSIEPKLITFDSAVPESEKIPNNYHYWLDPHLTVIFARKISAALQKLDPSHYQVYATNEQQLVNSINELESLLASTINDWNYRAYFCSHPAWTYFARRFALKELGCLKVDHIHEIGTKSLADLYKLAQSPDNRLFFIQQNEPTIAFQSFVDDNQLKVVTLDDLGSIDEPYTTLVKRNVARIASVQEMPNERS